ATMGHMKARWHCCDFALVGKEAPHGVRLHGHHSVACFIPTWLDGGIDEWSSGLHTPCKADTWARAPVHPRLFLWLSNTPSLDTTMSCVASQLLVIQRLSNGNGWGSFFPMRKVTRKQLSLNGAEQVQVTNREQA